MDFITIQINQHDSVRAFFVRDISQIPGMESNQIRYGRVENIQHTVRHDWQKHPLPVERKQQTQERFGHRREKRVVFRN